MVDMSNYIEPKSDQLTADDLLGGPRTITVTRVNANEGNAEQPVNVYFQDDDGRPFRPCRTMRRVIMAVWGKHTADYVGRSMTLFRDPKVKWGGMEVGGIRVSHMTGINEKKVLAVTMTRGAKKPYTVQPLTVDNASDKAAEIADKIIATLAKAPSEAKLDEYLSGKPAKNISSLRTDRPELAERIDKAVADKRAEFVFDADDDTPPYQSVVDEIIAAIEDALKPEVLDQAQEDFDKHKDALPDDVVADIDARIARARRELETA